MARHTPIEADEAFALYAGYHSTPAGRYVGWLRVVRKADGRVLFPFDGAPELGPYDAPDAARRAAIEYGREIIAADRASPEH